MRKVYFSLVSALAFIGFLFLQSCHKEIDDLSYDAYAGTEVYAAGIVNSQYPTYWRNGKMNNLNDRKFSGSAHQILGIANDIFAVGMTAEFYNATPSNARSAAYWKNGQQFIIDKTSDSEAYGLAITNSGDVYAYGLRYNQPINDWDTVWKNGQVYNLENFGAHVYVSSMKAIGNDIYVSGNTRTGGTWTGRVWKNGIIFKTYPSRAQVHIETNGSDLYSHVDIINSSNVRSYQVFKNDALLYNITMSPQEWDRTSTILQAQSGGDSYVVTARYNVNNTDFREVHAWKNGSKMTNINIKDIRDLTAVFVKGNDLYISTLNNYTNANIAPALYKNNTIMPMDVSGTSSAQFHSIYVK